MSGKGGEDRIEELVFDYELDASPEKVWRAVRMAAFRKKWLPDEALLDPEPVSSVLGREVSYRMRDNDPPYLVSVVVFQIETATHDRTRLKIIHRLTDARLQVGLKSTANSNGPSLMRAA